MREWEVLVQRSVAQEQTLFGVEADTEEEAKRLAIARARWEGTHDFWEDVGEYEITAPSAKPWPEESS